ncbi:MAG: DNA alkylation repair protein [Gemmatimonadales bacterium]
MTLSPLAQTIRTGLEKRRDRARASGAQAYMKSAMPYYGVPMPALREVCRAAFDAYPLTMAADWRRVIGELWDQATHREERYAAIELAAHPPYQRFISLALLPLYRRMVQEGAWWDYVDALSHRVGVLLATYPDRIKPTLRAWARHEHIWLRRVAILSQLDFGERTDVALLYDCIRPSLGSNEFFLRKAIGWALRTHAHTDPAEVRRFLAETGKELAPLSRREAEKGLKAPAVRRAPKAAKPARKPVKKAAKRTGAKKSAPRRPARRAR